jgi:uncharacterized membrane protein (UPF0127 family)
MHSLFKCAKKEHTAAFVLIGAFVLCSLSFLFFYAEQSWCPEMTVLEFDNRIYVVTLATSSRAREQGLSGSVSIVRDEGMLFVFDLPAQQNFWMKDMHYPIDIVWFDSHWRVLGVSPNATPKSYYTDPPTTFSSPKNTRYVLEISSGAA